MRQFKRLFLGVGLPLGAVIAVGLGGIRSASPIDFLATAGLAGAAMAAALTPLTRLFPRKPGSPFFNSVSALLVILPATVIAACVVLWLAALVPHGAWRRMPDAPQGARAFAGLNCVDLADSAGQTVYLLTESGQLFATPRDATSDGTWFAVASLPESSQHSYRCRGDPARRWATPLKLGRTVATYQIIDEGVDCGGHRHYRLMADGSVWTWSTGICALAILPLAVVYLLFASFLGVVAFMLRLPASTVHAPIPPPSLPSQSGAA